MSDTNSKVEVRNVDVSYGDKQALFDVSIDIPDRSVTAFIGPSGCGKSTFLRCLNRMNDTIEGARVDGSIKIDVFCVIIEPVAIRVQAEGLGCCRWV